MQGIVRKILAVLAVTAHFSNVAVFAEEEVWECPAKTGIHVGKICQCLEARRPGGAWAKSITDFVCPETTMGDQDAAYRVVLDLEFKEIDKKAEAKLKEMQARTGKDFVSMDQDTANWFDTTSTDSEFYKQYSKVCADLSDPKNPLRQTVESFPEWVVTDGSTDRFVGNKARCETLTANKLAAYKSASRIFASQNVADSYKSDKKDFIDKLKDMYRNFLMKWTVYIGELSRIKDKWNEKTPTVVK